MTSMKLYLLTTFTLIHSLTGFHPHCSLHATDSIQRIPQKTSLSSSRIVYITRFNDQEPNDDIDDESDEDNAVPTDPYLEVAPSEFKESSSEKFSPARLARGSDLDMGKSNLDWGGEYGKLSVRIEDIKNGASKNPSQVLFRILTSESPNQTISSFLKVANPQVVRAMSGAVASLLGSLSRPGIETIVKATGEKIGNLCFQLQMTGYMFRNAEYIISLKKLMQLSSGATTEDYRKVFDRLDCKKLGYIDPQAIKAFYIDIYGDDVPGTEINSFLQIFDANKDGRISWEEFKRGFGRLQSQEGSKVGSEKISLPFANVETDKEEMSPDLNLSVSGMIEIELENGRVVEVDANEYIKSLKQEAMMLKEALQKDGTQEKTIERMNSPNLGKNVGASENVGDGIANYIASRKDDLKTIAESVQPEIVETMKMLVDFVLQGGSTTRKRSPHEKIEMELPDSALQQLALWQLILGYKLREAEASGDYLRLIE
jgi:Protein of unknown function (DUF760)/EF-hand domain pair